MTVLETVKEEVEAMEMTAKSNLVLTIIWLEE
jgi:hypothetical protein